MPGASAVNVGNLDSARATAADVGKTVSHVSLWSALTLGDFLVWFPIHANSFGEHANAVQELVAEAQYRIAHRDLRLTQAATQNLDAAQGTVYLETIKMAERAINGRINGDIFVQFHDGNPGSAGTANVIAGLGRVQVDSFSVFPFSSADGSVPEHEDDGTVNEPIGPDPGHDDHGDGVTHNDEFGAGEP